MTDLLVIMAKYPTPGKVKTRLAAEIGARRAAEIYRALIQHHQIEFFDASFSVEWRYTPTRAPFRRVVSDGAVLRAQPDGSLGVRMRKIFAESFARGHRRVVMIGTDCPVMNQRVVRRAFRLLTEHSAVFQPTEDGGYALIGLTGMVDVFSKIAWSTPWVMAQTRQRLQSGDVSFTEMPATFDVDTLADLKRLKKGYL